jgi:hypothetical protein
MPFRPHIIDMLETGLSECFKFHNALDNFVLRAGLPQSRLTAARDRAEQRSQATGRFQKAPKRYVAQELLRDLGDGTSDDDRLTATLITALCKGQFRDATPEGLAAIEGLKAERVEEGREAAERRAEKLREQRAVEQHQERLSAAQRAKREQYRAAFLQLCEMTDPHQRGFQLERFLNEFLGFEGLNPRGSFKIIGEQIDGSFAWSASTYLVEAKWVKEPIAGAEFGAFIYKIAGKTLDTRGLYISINGYSTQAMAGLRQKGELRFVCIDGSHLLRALSYGRDFPKLLDVVWRHASETGEAYLPVSSARFIELEE